MPTDPKPLEQHARELAETRDALLHQQEEETRALLEEIRERYRATVQAVDRAIAALAPAGGPVPAPQRRERSTPPAPKAVRPRATRARAGAATQQIGAERRAAIRDLLAMAETGMTSRQIQEATGLSQSSVDPHLRALVDDGDLVIVEGTSPRVYDVAPDPTPPGSASAASSEPGEDASAPASSQSSEPPPAEPPGSPAAESPDVDEVEKAWQEREAIAAAAAPHSPTSAEGMTQAGNSRAGRMVVDGPDRTLTVHDGGQADDVFTSMGLMELWGMVDAREIENVDRDATPEQLRVILRADVERARAEAHADDDEQDDDEAQGDDDERPSRLTSRNRGPVNDAEVPRLEEELEAAVPRLPAPGTIAAQILGHLDTPDTIGGIAKGIIRDRLTVGVAIDELERQGLVASTEGGAWVRVETALSRAVPA